MGARDRRRTAPIVLNDGVVPPGGSEATTPCVPDFRGGTVFNPPSYDPALQLFFVMARETCAYYTPHEAGVSAGRVLHERRHARSCPSPTAARCARSIRRPATIKWEYKFPTASLAGVMSTASGLVFAGDKEGYFNAFDAQHAASGCGRTAPARRSGAPPACTYMLDGRQYVLIPSGNTLVAFALPEG